MSYYVTPTEESFKDFRRKIKEKTHKNLTFNKEVWIGRANPIIRGKVNYYVIIVEAIKENQRLGQKSHCVTRWIRSILMALDGYIRRKL